MRTIIIALIFLASLALPIIATEVRLNPREASTTLNQDVWRVEQPLSFPDSLFPASTSRSYSFWVYITAPATTNYERIIFSKGTSNPLVGITAGHHIIINSDGVVMNLSSAQLNPSTWYHVAFTHGGGEARAYIDGVEVESQTGVPDPVNSAEPLRNSGDLNPGSQHVNTWVYDLRYSDQVMMPAEIQAAAEVPTSDVLAIPSWRRDGGSFSAMSIATTDYNPEGLPIHPDFSETLRVDSVNVAGGITVTKDITGALGDGFTFEFDIHFYDDFAGGGGRARNDWVAVGPDTGSPPFVHRHGAIGVYPNGNTYSHFKFETQWTRSSVPRSVGWHKFSFKRTGSGSPVTLWVDDIQIGATNELNTTPAHAISIRGDKGTFGIWSPWPTTAGGGGDSSASEYEAPCGCDSVTASSDSNSVSLSFEDSLRGQPCVATPA